ncbi:hypothetical protein [Olsenella sp. An290]|uniref:hypothetical protein n=1 Tax=Olsenella sp. An290 TaxID=1965625 RepID=UPI000B373DFF|nr:hypothetical protein [Olsenella sp. An290]OUO32780.1 hypothetical protein B5F84_09150 [Olsenella sp. An290]
MGERLIIGFDSALEFWRRARAAAPSAPDLEPAGHVFGAQRLSVPERAARVCEGYGLEAPLTLVAAGRDRRYACRGVSFLTWSGPLPDALLFGLGDDVFVCRMPLALSQLSRSYDEIGLAEVAYEMAGTYGLAPWAHNDLVKDVRPLTDVSELVSYAQAARALGTYGSSKVLAALALVVPNSNSPRETGLGIYMMQSRARGGARLGGFRMNEPLELPSQLQEFLGQRVIKPDFLWPNGTVMEYDSDDWHLSPRKKAADERKRRAYRAEGLDHLTMTSDIPQSQQKLDAFMADLEKSLGLRRRPASDVMERRRRELRGRLFGPESNDAALALLR